MPSKDEDETAAASKKSNSVVNLSTNASPFLLKAQDVEILAQSEGFNILREHLAQTYAYEFCDEHKSDSPESLSRWLIVRDVLHALLVPVVELFDKSSTLAFHATHASNVEDLEYAYSEQARSAFVWLQCFLSNEKEREWCYTRGCPACVVNHTLDSEFSIRLLYAACLLSDVHYPFTLDGPTLPSFIFFLDSLEQALTQDELYGADFFERTSPKAMATRNGIEELIQQCVELELVLSEPSSPVDPGSADSSVESSPVLGAMGPKSTERKPAMKVKRSRLARRQRSIQMEEQQWIEEMARRCTLEERIPVTAADSTIAMDEKITAGPIATIREVSSAG